MAFLHNHTGDPLHITSLARMGVRKMQEKDTYFTLGVGGWGKGEITEERKEDVSHNVPSHKGINGKSVASLSNVLESMTKCS